MNKVLILLLFSIMALGLSAQTPISTQSGIVPVHNLRVEDTTYFGQLIGIWAIDAGDTMFGFVPVYVLPDSTLLVGSDTVYSSGNPQVITLSGDVTGSGTSSIVTNIAAGAVGATELQTGAVTTVKIAASAVDSTKIGANAVGPSELQSTAVSPGSYTLSSVTVDADGRLTAASTGTVNLASQVTGTLPVANGGTGATTLAGAGIATTATGTANYLPKYTEGTVLGQSQIFDNGTNVGIGNTLPSQRLHVTGNIFSDGTNAQFLGDDAVNSVTAPTYSFSGDTDNGIYRPAADNIGLVTNGTEKVRITSAGNVGIGTTSPGSPLVIRGTTATDGGQLGSELLTSANWTTTDWTGDFTTGFTHTTGNTTALTNTLAAVVNNYYQIAYTITNRTAGSISIAFGGQTISGVTASGAFGPRATTTGTLAITPTSDFNGTIVISIRVITQGSPLIALQTSNGAVVNHINSVGNNNTNVLFGLNAGLRLTTGTENVAIGRNALQNATTPRLNVAIGDNALATNTTGAFNTAIGGQVLSFNITGNNNIAVGQGALTLNTIGSDNTAVGASTLVNNTTGNFNVAIGRAAFQHLSTGSENVAIGQGAGQLDRNSANLTSASNSIFIGRLSRANANGEENQIVIGYNIAGEGSNSVVLGNTSITKTVLRGNVGIGTTTPTNHLDVNGSARIRTFTGTPKRIIGADLSGVLDTLVLGSGLSITSGTLNTTNNGTITSIATSAPLTGGPITSTGTIGITQANSTTNGFISSTDWNTFNNKLSAEVDGSTTNELQNLSLTGQSLGISSGTGVTLPIIDVAAGTGVTVSKTGGVATVSATSTGTVSSVGLTMPSGFTVSNSPVTTSGTLAVTTTLNGPLRGNGSGLTTGNTNLASEVTGTLPVANGGTGATTITANKVLVGNGTSTVLSPTNLHWDNTNSRLGISETSPAYPLDINANTAMRLPRGLDTNQPAAAAGLLRFSTTTNTVDWSDGSNWYKGISGEGQGPSSNFNRVALWSGASTQTSDADLTFNPSTGQLKMLKYTGASTFAGTSVAELHVTSTGEVITKTPRDTQYVHLVAVTPGTAVTQTAGFDFFQGSFLMPEHLDNYTLSRADYAITNSTATTGSLIVRIRYYETTNSGGSTACAVTFTGADVRESSTNGVVMPKGYWMHAEVGSTNGTLNNTVEGLLVTLMFTK